MPRTLTEAELNHGFSVLCGAAAHGLRCPFNGANGLTVAVVDKLARRGRIRITLSRQNWRRVTILRGPYAGKSTAPDPQGEDITLVIDHTGKHRPGEAGATIPHSGRAQPSAPQSIDPTWGNR